MKDIIWIVPHTHFDTEVFLTWSETIEIGISNILGALNLLKAQPDYKFVLDQTCYIEAFLKNYPEEKQFFLDMVNSRRIEITCGMYAMPDVNMPSGESFIRQVSIGKQFCESELGQEIKCGWLIDTFGMHPQMPQLMRKCGFTHNVYARVMPYENAPSEFFWKGIDGTSLLCHWMPRSYAILYGSPKNIHEFTEYFRRRLSVLKKHAVTNNLLALSGADITPFESHLAPMIELYNAKDPSCNLRIATPQEYFGAIASFEKFPVLEGDFNPVFQGCYSARIDLKQLNRRIENKIVDCEKYEAIGNLFFNYSDRSDWTSIWKPVLFNQFHDTICGTHVDEVFENSIDRYKYTERTCNEVLEKRLNAIQSNVNIVNDGIPVIVFNQLSWERTDFVECNIGFSDSNVFDVEVKNSKGELCPCDIIIAERYENGSIRKATLLFIARDVPAVGYEVYYVASKKTDSSFPVLPTSRPYHDLRNDFNVGRIENEFFRLEFDMWSGVLTSIFDKRCGWEVIPGKQKMGNFVVKEQDYGNLWQYGGPCKGDALVPLNKKVPLPDLQSATADFSFRYEGDAYIKSGVAFAEFGISHLFGSGSFSTKVRLYAGIPRIDIQTSLVNNDERVRYRIALPTSITNGKITYEIPFGAIERPEDEFPAQNWIDYSKDDKGVAILNKGLPGNNVTDGVMMLSVLKCTGIKEGYGETGGFKYTTATERGYELGKKHTFDYSIVPHNGDWRQAGIVQRGMEFNNPLIYVKSKKQKGTFPASMSFITLSNEAVILSAVKQCDNGMILRVYESTGKPQNKVVLNFCKKIQKVFETNMLEQEQKEIVIKSEDSSICFDICAFEIKTFKVILSNENGREL